MLPLITLEEHYISSALQASPYAKSLGLDLFPPKVGRKLLSLDGERIRDMDEAGVRLQVVSHNPAAGALPLDMCVQANNQLHEATLKHPDRLAALAALPMNDPMAAAEELTRCVQDMKFVGALVSNHADGQYYDDPRYWPVFERAQDLDIPIYLHPTFATEAKMADFKGHFNHAAAEAMSAYAWGWHSEVGVHFLRLFASGLFDRLPRLKIILGHNGEMLPYMVDRIERFSGQWGERERSFRTVWTQNIWVTTSGMFTLAPLLCLLRTVKIDRVLFSIDYPFEDNMEGRRFMDAIRESGLVSDEHLEMIAYRNAESLLKVRLKV